MALSLVLGEAGFTPRRIDTSAAVDIKPATAASPSPGSI